MVAKAVYVEPNSVLVSWNKVEQADHYDLWVWRVDDPGWQHLVFDNVTEYLHAGLARAATYVYAVQFCIGDVCSGYAQPYAEIKVPATTGTPDLKVTYQEEPNSVTISWTPVHNAQWYELWVWWADDPGWQSLGRELTDTSVVHSGLTPGVTYHYCGRAFGVDQTFGEWMLPCPTVTIPQ